MKKVTFYGRDFTPISAAGVKGHLLGEPIDGCGGLTYSGLLQQFAEKYKIPGSEHSLYFYANHTMFGGCVGVFRHKNFQEATTKNPFDITLEIRCRFDAEDKGASFLAAMLLCLTNEGLPFAENETVSLTFQQVMDVLLLFLFKKQLAGAAQKGIFRKYQRFENNDSRLHGSIDVARHIRENMGLERGSIAYHYRELTANNPVNHLILAAYRRLCEKYPTLCETHINRSERVYSTLNILQTELGHSKTRVRNIVTANLRPVTHPYFSEYEELRKTCLKILRDEGVSIFDADSCEETESLHVDVTRLWEQFLEFHLKKQAEQLGLTLTAQDEKQLFAERKDKSSNPDFVLWQGGQARAILDAKFKPLWNKFFSGSSLGEGGRNPAIDDDINKCIRDMVVFRARRTGVIFPFPETEGKNGLYHKAYHIGGSDGGAPWFDMVRVSVPQRGEESFEDWYQKLESAVNQALKDYLNEILSTGAALQRSASDKAKPQA